MLNYVAVRVECALSVLQSRRDPGGTQAGPVVDAGGLFEYARQTGMIKAA